MYQFHKTLLQIDEFHPDVSQEFQMTNPLLTEYLFHNSGKLTVTFKVKFPHIL